jgi:hypothetical protein
MTSTGTFYGQTMTAGDMDACKSDLHAVASAELRSRRDRLAASLPGAAGFLAGSLAEQRRTCGKKGCRCAEGESHGPYAYLAVAGRMVYVPAVQGDAVRARLEGSARLREALEEISAINLELLDRRELD